MYMCVVYCTCTCVIPACARFNLLKCRLCTFVGVHVVEKFSAVVWTFCSYVILFLFVVLTAFICWSVWLDEVCFSMIKWTLWRSSEKVFQAFQWVLCTVHFYLEDQFVWFGRILNLLKQKHTMIILAHATWSAFVTLIVKENVNLQSEHRAHSCSWQIFQNCLFEWFILQNNLCTVGWCCLNYANYILRVLFQNKSLSQITWSAD